MRAPIFTSFDCIYPGPHLDKYGKLDPRVWFSMPVELDVEDGSITYLIFPHNGSQDEIKEITVSASGSWID